MATLPTARLARLTWLGVGPRFRTKLQVRSRLLVSLAVLHSDPEEAVPDLYHDRSSRASHERVRPRSCYTSNQSNPPRREIPHPRPEPSPKLYAGSSASRLLSSPPDCPLFSGQLRARQLQQGSEGGRNAPPARLGSFRKSATAAGTPDNLGASQDRRTAPRELANEAIGSGHCWRFR